MGNIDNEVNMELPDERLDTEQLFYLKDKYKNEKEILDTLNYLEEKSFYRSINSLILMYGPYTEEYCRETIEPEKKPYELFILDMRLQEKKAEKELENAILEEKRIQTIKESIPLKIEAQKLSLEIIKNKIELISLVLKYFPLRIIAAEKRIKSLELLPKAIELWQKDQKKEIGNLLKNSQLLDQEAKDIESDFQKSKIEVFKIAKQVETKVRTFQTILKQIN